MKKMQTSKILWNKKAQRTSSKCSGWTEGYAGESGSHQKRFSKFLYSKLETTPKFKYFSSNFLFSWENLKVCFHSLTYNHHMNMNYASDVCMEPIFWFVDNYTHLLGPFLVAGVIFLTTSVVSIAYWIGVPYYQEHHPNLILPLIIVGNWLLINVVYHYYKAVKTPPGFPPEVTNFQI